MTMTAMPGGFRPAGSFIRTFGKAFVIYGRRFVPFVVITMMASVPGVVLSAAPFMSGGGYLAGSGAATATSLLGAAAAILASAAVTYCVVEERHGRVPSPAGAIRFLVQRLPPLSGVAILTAAAMAWGVLAVPVWSRVGAVLPGALTPLLSGVEVSAVVNTVSLALGIVVVLVPWCMFCLSMPVCIAEHAGVLASMSESRRLTRGHRLTVFATLLVFALGVLILHAAFAGVFAGVLASAGPLATVVSNAVLGVIDSSVYGVLAGVLYDDLRLARDGVDPRLAGVFD